MLQNCKVHAKELWEKRKNMVTIIDLALSPAAQMSFPSFTRKLPN